MTKNEVSFQLLRQLRALRGYQRSLEALSNWKIAAYKESQNHRMAWVEKDHNDHLVSTSLCYVQGRQPLDQSALCHMQPGLECLQGWGIHNLQGQPVPVPHHPLGEKTSSKYLT